MVEKKNWEDQENYRENISQKHSSKNRYVDCMPSIHKKGYVVKKMCYDFLYFRENFDDFYKSKLR